MTNGVGGRVHWCEKCGRRRCIAPQTMCQACRPAPVATRARRRESSEVTLRKRKKQWLKRQSSGMVPGCEYGGEGHFGSPAGEITVHCDTGIEETPPSEWDLLPTWSRAPFDPKG